MHAVLSILVINNTPSHTKLTSYIISPESPNPPALGPSVSYGVGSLLKWKQVWVMVKLKRCKAYHIDGGFVNHVQFHNLCSFEIIFYCTVFQYIGLACLFENLRD